MPNSVPELLKRKIIHEGPIPFRDFMEWSLYYPGCGYYTSDREKIGDRGDFYTSPWFTTLFGDMLAVQLEEMWGLLGGRPFTIVEYGAGTGVLCRDILRRLKANPVLYEKVRYVIIEKSLSMRSKEKLVLREAGLLDRVSWIDSIDEIAPVEGCILSNELIDNFSIHRVVNQEELMEIFVDYQDEKFVECLRPASPALKEYFAELQVNLSPGFQAEINLDAVTWIRGNARALHKGFLLTIDYGYPSAGLYRADRDQGTMVCYHRHQVGESPYEHIGEQDITSHVNFSALRHWGEQAGLEYGAFTNQAHFLQGLGLGSYLRRLEESGAMNDWKPEQKSALVNTLLLGMGNKFKVLLQHKGLHTGPERPHRPMLSGFRFAQPLV